MCLHGIIQDCGPLHSLPDLSNDMCRSLHVLTTHVGCVRVSNWFAAVSVQWHLFVLTEVVCTLIWLSQRFDLRVITTQTHVPEFQTAVTARERMAW